tara:strand:- start:2594 stop:3121 length:528 start_codon:yes stop_codon:yes gene_type:complete
MSWFEIINKQVDMGELMARIRAEQDESESNKEQERRKKLGLPEEDIEDGVKINWMGYCPKCGIRVNKSWEIVNKAIDSDFRPSAHKHTQRWKKEQENYRNIKCPYFKKVGKLEGKHGGPKWSAFTTKETKDASAADECPMAAPDPKTYKETNLELTTGIEHPNPDYDPTKGKFDI